MTGPMASIAGEYGLSQLLLEHVPAAVAVFDREMRYRAVSRRWLSDYRLASQDVLGRCPYDLFPDIPDRWRAIHARALGGEKLSCIEDPFPRDDGTLDWVDWEIVPWYNAPGQIGGVILFTQVVTERVESAQAAQASSDALSMRQRWMETAIDSLTDAHLQTDGAGRVVACNAAFASFFGVSREEAHLAPFHTLTKQFELRLPEGGIVAEDQWPIARALRGEAQTGVTLNLRRIDSEEERSVSHNFAPVRGENGEIAGCVVTFRDTSTETAMRQALQKSGERSRALAEELDLLIDGVRDHAIYMLDSRGRVTIWNQGASRLTGWSPEEVLGADARMFYSLADRDAGLPDSDWIRAKAAGGFSRDSIHLRKDGTAFFARTSTSPLHDEDGTLRGYCQIIRDISKQRDTELRLSASAARFRSIVESVPDAMVVINGEGAIIAFSRVAETMFGYCEHEMLGRNVSLLMPATHAVKHDDYLRLLRETGDRQIIGIGRVVTALRSNGEEFPIELYVGDASYDHYTVYTAFIRDLTEQQRNAAHLEDLRAQLTHVTRVTAMGTMASTMAHELNQPLMAVVSYVEGARKLLTDVDPMIVEALESASSEAVRAGDILRRLRTFVARGEVDLRYESLASIVAEALELVEVWARDQETEIVVALASDADAVLVDRVQTEQVLINLVRNAVEALADISIKRVLITSRAENAHFVRVSVRDTGKGLKPAATENLFRAFGGTKRAGMGLGLSICRTIVEANGGRIWYERGAGQGSTFHFTVPRANIEQVDAGEKTPRIALGRRPRHSNPARRDGK